MTTLAHPPLATVSLSDIHDALTDMVVRDFLDPADGPDEELNQYEVSA